MSGHFLVQRSGSADLLGQRLPIRRHERVQRIIQPPLFAEPCISNAIFGCSSAEIYRLTAGSFAAPVRRARDQRTLARNRPSGKTIRNPRSCPGTGTCLQKIIHLIVIKKYSSRKTFCSYDPRTGDVPVFRFRSLSIPTKGPGPSGCHADLPSCFSLSKCGLSGAKMTLGQGQEIADPDFFSTSACGFFLDTANRSRTAPISSLSLVFCQRNSKNAASRSACRLAWTDRADGLVLSCRRNRGAKILADRQPLGHGP